ncbi:MAG: hypothetical protein JXO72_00680 [Vicinamibacteria bacterium]|nr:hypothetical protein [Vicinamibacteria bacterium]
MRLELKYPATSANAADHARLAVDVAKREYDDELDFSPASLETLDGQIENLREQGISMEEAAEVLFVMGCYLGEVMTRALSCRWTDTERSPLAGLSPWPMVVVAPDGSGWDAIGKVYKRLEIGDSEYLPAFFLSAARASRS